MGPKGAWLTSRDLLLNFGTPSISKERRKIETSNLVHGLMARRPIQKVAKLGQLGTEPGSRDLPFKFCVPLYIYGTAEDTNFKFGSLHGIDDEEAYPKSCKIRSNGKMPHVT